LSLDGGATWPSLGRMINRTLKKGINLERMIVIR